MQNIKQIEPPFWWFGMKNTTLQLLIYGKKINTYKVEIPHSEVELISVKKTKNPNYLFLYLNLKKINNPETIKIYFSENYNYVETIDYQLKEREINIKKHQGCNSSDVVYLLMPDRFSEGEDSNCRQNKTSEKVNRKNPDGRHGGNLQGIINHLNYFNELGVTTLWLTPVFENNMPNYSYHGYAATNFYQIDPRLGTNEKYKELVEKCQEQNLKIIIDLVFNHCGSNHWWLKDLPENNWIHQFKTYTKTNNRITALIDPYASEADKKLMNEGWFDTHMPDLNQKNNHLAKYLEQYAKWWIEFSGVNGVRIDTFPYADKQYMAQLVQEILREYPNIYIVGEAWVQKIALNAYWQGNQTNKDGYDSHLPAVMDFQLFYSIALAFNEKCGWSTGLSRLYYTLVHDYLYPNPQMLQIFVDNHDTDRFFTIVNNRYRKFKMAVTFLLTIRGIPQIYYGTEILMNGYEHEGHGYIREDFPGGWSDDKMNAFTAKGRTYRQNKAFNYLQKLLLWRQKNPVIHTGKLTQFAPENDTYVYFRHNENKTIMIAFNNHEKENKIIELDRFKECIKNTEKAYDIMKEKTISIKKILKIEYKSVRILELIK